jgi:pyrroloquinoline-quinone synthase
LSEATAATERRPELERHAEEERDHVALWDDFVEAAGGRTADAATPETTHCARSWSQEADLLACLVSLYAIESGQPAISKTKREGLAAHYGIGDGPGNEYFRVHEEADVDHAAEGRTLIEAHLADADPEALVAAAESVFKANWRLLDGVTG